MLYHLHELQRRLMNPLSVWAQATSELFSSPYSPLAYTPMSRRFAAGYELLHRLGKRYEKPEIGLVETRSTASRCRSSRKPTPRNPSAGCCIWLHDGAARAPGRPRLQRRDPEFSAAAQVRLARHGIENVTLEVGDAARGWARHSPHDVIVLTGSVPVLPEAFTKSLKAGGRLLAVVGEAPVMQARLVTCEAEAAWRATTLFETVIPPLRNAPQREKFVF